MSEIELRPRFRITTSKPTEEVIKNLSNERTRDSTKINGRVVDHHAVLKLPENEISFWSPQLDIEVETNSDGKGEVRGLFGPRPNLSLLFMFIYMVFAILTFFAITWGFSQLSNGQTVIGFTCDI